MAKSAIEPLEKWTFLLPWWTFEIMIHATSVVKNDHFLSNSMVVAKMRWLKYVKLSNDNSDEIVTFVCVYEDSKYHQMALIGFDT